MSDSDIDSFKDLFTEFNKGVARGASGDELQDIYNRQTNLYGRAIGDAIEQDRDQHGTPNLDRLPRINHVDNRVFIHNDALEEVTGMDAGRLTQAAGGKGAFDMGEVVVTKDGPGWSKKNTSMRVFQVGTNVTTGRSGTLSTDFVVSGGYVVKNMETNQVKIVTEHDKSEAGAAVRAAIQRREELFGPTIGQYDID